MKNITVIGAGLSGTLLTMNLLRQHPLEKLAIHWIDLNDEKQMGPAYSTEEEYLLNVPVEMMGAFSGDPEHFLRWARQKQNKVERGDYLPRKMYREYIQSVLQEAVHSKDPRIELKRLRDEATDIEPVNGQLVVKFRKSEKVVSDAVVLALGNFPPPHPPARNEEWIRSDRYVQNPWYPDLLDRISKDESILFVGTGQTMVDLVTGLYRRKHQGRLIGVSRRGILPLSHKKVDPYPSFYHEIEDLDDFTVLFHVVRKHIRKAEALGLDRRAVIDSLRAHTIDIWLALPDAEKKRFLRHAFRYWEVIRSRIPPASERIINDMIASGQLQVEAGRIEDVEAGTDILQVMVRKRKSNKMKQISVHWVINCRGANPDYEKIDNKLVRNLMRKKLIGCDPVHLGMNATPGGRIIQPDGNQSHDLYTLGPAMKGVVWESLATPEIRVQAENLAEKLI